MSVDLEPHNPGVKTRGIPQGSRPLNVPGSTSPLPRSLPPLDEPADTSHSENAHNDHDSVVPLQICKGCQEALLRSFEHCISTTGYTFPSPLMIDEEEHSKRKNPPPYFEAIPDPITIKHRFVVDPLEQAAKGRVVRLEGKATNEQIRNSLIKTRVSKAAAAAELAAVAAATTQARENWKSKSVPNYHSSFSGAIFRQMLQAKDRELERLQAIVYQMTVTEIRDAEEKGKLQHALHRSMRYYVNAEEWQAKETGDLKQDVKHLKAELSSLVAALINNTIEKDKLKSVIEEGHKKIAERDEKYVKLQGEYDGIKSRLHQQLKEYITVNEIIDQLKIEARQGSELLQNKNEFLQVNLNKVTNDYKAASTELAVYKERVSGLEMELGELVGQFETVSEDKLGLGTKCDQYVEDLKTTTYKLMDVEERYKIASVLNTQLTEQLRDLNSLHVDSKYDLENRILQVSKNLDEMTAAKKEVDDAARQLKTANDKLKSGLKEITRGKDQLETQLRVLELKSDKDIKAREAHISMLQKDIVENKDSIKSLTETRERLMFQINDLKSMLDREQSQHNTAVFDLTEAKRVSAEKVTAFEEQITKLTAAKTNLNSDKKQLIDTLKDVRQALRAKEEDFASLETQHGELKSQTSTRIADLEIKLRDAKEAYKSLAEQHNSLKKKHTSLVATSTELNAAHKRGIAEIEVLKKEKESNIAEIQRLQLVRTALEEDISRLELTKRDTKIHLDGVLVRFSELESSAKQAALDASSAISNFTQEIEKSNATISDLKDEKKQADDRIRLAVIRYGQLQREYQISQELLRQETAARAAIELNLDDTRSLYQQERKTRIEFERLHTRFERRSRDKDTESLALARMRERKMVLIDETLSKEHSRLVTIADIIESAA